MRFGIPQTPFVLGSLGLVPFVLTALIKVSGDGTDAGLVNSLAALSTKYFLPYALSIVSFMAAIHWSWAMTNQNFRLGYFSAIGITLITWAFHNTLMVYPAAFLAILLGDFLASRRGIAPAWYLPLRLYLTIVVLASLLVLLS